MNEQNTTIDAMIGKIATAITGESGDDKIVFSFSDGTAGTFLHHQDCCENVSVEDINGDWSDLIGSPIIVADERVSTGEVVDDGWSDSTTWTFYTFRTIKGSVDVRWLGTSNGHYSERVDLVWNEAQP